jgi:predicted nucleic acid-binding protein
VRVVIDSSVVVAALATPNPESASRVVLAAVAAGAVELVIADDLEAEYRRAVEYSQVRRQAARVNRQGFVDAIVATADRIEASSAAGAVPADPGDDMVVAAAFARPRRATRRPRRAPGRLRPRAAGAALIPVSLVSEGRSKHRRGG